MLALQVRRVLDQIRGRSYEEALMLLEYMPFRACEPVLKTLVSVRLVTNTVMNDGLTHPADGCEKERVWITAPSTLKP